MADWEGVTTVSDGDHTNMKDERRTSAHQQYTGAEAILHRQLTLGQYTASIWSWLSLIALAVTCLFHIIAFSTNGWVEIKNTDATGSTVTREIGLWQSCLHFSNGQGFTCRYHSVSELSDGERATQTFAIFALLGVFTSVVISMTYVFFLNMYKDPRLAVAFFICRAVTALFMLITVSIYANHWDDRYATSEYDGKLEYSFNLDVCCIFSEAIGAGLVMLDILQFLRQIDDM